MLWKLFASAPKTELSLKKTTKKSVAKAEKKQPPKTPKPFNWHEWSLYWLLVTLWGIGMGLMFWHIATMEYLSLELMFSKQLALNPQQRQLVFIFEIVGAVFGLLVGILGALKYRNQAHFFGQSFRFFGYSLLAIGAVFLFQTQFETTGRGSWEGRLWHIISLAVLFGGITYAAQKIWFIRLQPTFQQVLKHEKWYALGLVALVMGLYAILAYQNFQNFEHAGLDYTLFAQGIWKYAQLEVPWITFGGDSKLLHSEHSHFSLLLLTPFWWLSDSVYTLMYVDLICLGVMSWFVYLLARHVLSGSTIRLWALGLFLLHFGIQNAIQNSYHEINLAAMFFAGALYGALVQRWWTYSFMVLGCLLTKESSPLWLAFLGLFLFVFERRYLAGSLTILLSVVTFILLMQWLLPDVLGPGSYEHFSFSDLGEDPKAAVITLITDPIYSFGLLVSHELKVQTLWYLTLSFGAVFLLAPRFLILLIPFLAERLFNSLEPRWHVWGYYNVAIIVPLAVASLYGLKNLPAALHWAQERIPGCPLWGDKKLAGMVGTTVLIVMIHITDYSFISKAFNDGFWTRSKSEISTRKAIDLIPPNATVQTQSTIGSFLAHRDYIKSFPFGLTASAAPESKKNFYNYERYQDKFATDTHWQHMADYFRQEPEYIVINPDLIRFPLSQESEFEYWLNQVRDQYKLIFNEGGARVYRKRNSEAVIPSPFQ